ncbi:MAG: tryptophan--tRNA ligase, partial [Hyphomonas sp.]|nr:tryptophan--tRNA ligase [Hyphomonas sp.]
ADRFNREYDVPGFFPLPEPLIKGPGARIMSLKDGTKKMSKSDPSDLSRINLVDDSDTIAKKIKKATTDPLGPMPEDVKGLEGRPEVENLVGIYSAVTGESVEAIIAQYAGQGFGVFKPALAEIMVGHLAPITARYREIMADPSEIDRILADGAERANAIAAPIMEDVRRAVGYWRP